MPCVCLLSSSDNISNSSGTKRIAAPSSLEPQGKKKRRRKEKKQGSSIASGKITSSALPHIDKLIPDAFKACTTGWVEKDISTSAYTIVSEDHFVEKYLGQGLVETYEHIAKSMGQHLRTKGQECNAVNALNALIQLSTFEDIASYTTEELVKKGHDYVSSYETTRRFFATKLLRSRFAVSTKCAWERFMIPLSRANNFTLLDVDRYNSILTCLKGYDVQGRTGNEEDTLSCGRKI